jgi:serine protease Do
VSKPARIVLLILATLVVVPLRAEVATVQLRGGAAIKGEILRRKSDRLVIDLGFAVVTVPVDEIESIVTEDEREDPAADSSGDIYRVAPDQDELTVKENLARVAEAVVEVRTPTSLGSGFIIDPLGYVVTNDHVIAGENRISVTLFHRGDKQLEKLQYNDVTIVATNPFADLALLKISEADAELSSVPLADSDRVRQGQPVFAVGSPLGLERSVSEGIVSLKNRAIRGRLFIQSTTQLNPGNSGGPLFNLRGEVVGVNNLKITAAGIEGLNFSIAGNVLKAFLNNRDAFAFDPRNPNAGFRYQAPPRPAPAASDEEP